MIDFIKRLFSQSTSSATAKERLRLVLMTDHLELAPEMIDAMKRDLVDVISRFVEVDRDRIDVTFERQDRALAMLANIPILSVNRATGNGTPEAAPASNGTNGSTAAKTGTNGKKATTRKRRSRKKTQSAATAPPLAPAEPATAL